MLHDVITKMVYSKIAFRRTQKFGSKARMFLTSGYVLIACVPLVKSGFLHALKRIFLKKLDVLQLRLACS